MTMSKRQKFKVVTAWKMRRTAFASLSKEAHRLQLQGGGSYGCPLVNPLESHKTQICLLAYHKIVVEGVLGSKIASKCT